MSSALPRTRKSAKAPAAAAIRCRATLLRPRNGGQTSPTAKAATWYFLILPKEASAKLPSRGQVSVEGTLNGAPFRATLEPDGQGGHWLKVDRTLRKAAGRGGKLLEAGDVVDMAITPAMQEPEPKLPADLRKALAAAPSARAAWKDITPAARRDFIHWVVSPKQAETRARRIRTACDMLAKGKRRPCCFDRSGMYSKSLTCPEAEDRPEE